MRAWAFVGAAGVALTVLGQLDPSAAVVEAGLRAGATVLLAVLAHGGGSLAGEVATWGAGGARAYETARPLLPLVSSGLMLASVFGVRAMRASSLRELAAHLLFAFAGGVTASWAARAGARSEVTLWLFAVTFAAVLSSTPWLMPREGLRGLALRWLAARAEGPVRWRLLRGLALARRLGDAPGRSRDPGVGRALEEVLVLASRSVHGGAPVALARSIRRLEELERAGRVRGW